MVFKKKKKDKSRKLPYFYADTTNVKYWEWCVKNRIGILVVPSWDTADMWNIEITMKDNTSIDPKEFKGIEAINKMYEYCKYYYDKHNEIKK